jgi:hypothetical protein
MTDADLERMLEYCERATVGPWWVVGHELREGAEWVAPIRGQQAYLGLVNCPPSTGSGLGTVALIVDDELNEVAVNGEFISRARTDLPAVIRELQRARALLREMGHND